MNDQTGKLARGAALEHPHLCDICERPRNRGKHDACSRIRQEKYRAMRKGEQ